MHDVQERQAGSDLLSAEQVEAMLGVDKSTVYRMAADGRLAAIKVGRQWRFPVGPIRALLDGAGVGHLADGAGEPARAQSAPREPVTAASNAIQPVLDVAADLLGVMMVATDMDGNPLTDVANPCPWFAERSDDPHVLDTCIQDWKALAADLDFEPRLAPGGHGFECARAYIRDGDRLVGMVLAGGILPLGAATPGLYDLDEAGRAAVVAALPRVATTISRVVSRPTVPPTPIRSTP
jgi:excisionase family DNA binding protein